MTLRRLRLAIIFYSLFDLLIGGYCGGLIPLAISQAGTTLTLASGGLGISCNAVTASTSSNPGTAAGCISFNLLTSGGNLPVLYTWQVITTGSPASTSVTLVGSLDGVTWTTLDTNTSASSRTLSAGASYRFLGCVPGTLSGGSSPTLTCQISVSSGTTGGTAGVASFTGDSTILNNSASTGAVTATLANAGADTVLGNNTGSSAAPTYTNAPVVSSISAVGASGVSAGAVGTAGVHTWVGSTSGSATITAPAVAGTATNPLIVSNALQTPASIASYCVGAANNCFGGTGSSNLNINPGGTNAIFIDAQSFLTQAGLLLHPVSSNLLRVASPGFTTAANTSLQAITGLVWTAVSNRAGNYNFHCALSYSQATGTAAVAFGIQAATNAPTNIFATGHVQITAGPPSTYTDGVLATLTTTTATNIVSVTPGATGTNYLAMLDGTLELAASANTVNFMVSTATSADAVTVLRGSYCMIF